MTAADATTAPPASDLPTPDEVLAVFRGKFGDAPGSAPHRRLRYGYFTPDDVYEATVAKLVTPGCRWLDVGGGRDVFPTNPPLAAALAARCGTLVAVDPSPNVHENPVAHEKVEAFIEQYHADRPFDVLTLRMVAEHIADPDAAAAALARLTAPGGAVVVHTINVWAPVSLAAWAVPFGLHHPLKRAVWGTEERDTFPVTYRMNTRRALRRVMARHGLRESAFAYLDDCRTFGKFRTLNHLEMATRSACRSVGLAYPENCLLGVYRKADRSPPA